MTVRALLDRCGATVRTTGSERGLVGAAAAIAWRETHPTWELIAYRAPGRTGSSRRVDAESVRSVRRRYPELFLCDDPHTRRLLVAPHTPCPILYGLRGTRPEAPLAARRLVVSEPVDRWMLFRTNQGSGDHLVRRTVRELAEYRSAVVVGTVDERRRTSRGATFASRWWTGRDLSSRASLSSRPRPCLESREPCGPETGCGCGVVARRTRRSGSRGSSSWPSFLGGAPRVRRDVRAVVSPLIRWAGTGDIGVRDVTVAGRPKPRAGSGSRRRSAGRSTTPPPRRDGI